MSEVGDTSDDTGCGDLLRIKNIGNIHHEDVYYKSFLGGTVVSRQENKQNLERKGGNKSVVIVAAIAIVIIAVLVGVIVFLLKPQEEEKPRNVVVTPENVEEVIEQMKEEEKVPVGAYEVSMNTEWIFLDGESISENAFVENSTANTNMMYFIITINDGEEIYHSPYMEVGSYLESIQLDKDVPKGDYDAVITYHLVDEEFNDLSQVSMRMKIVVEN